MQDDEIPNWLADLDEEKDPQTVTLVYLRYRLYHTVSSIFGLFLESWSRKVYGFVGNITMIFMELKIFPRHPSNIWLLVEWES